MTCRTLFTVLVMFFLIPGIVSTTESGIWWQIELTVSVSGTYQLVANNEPFSGHYSFKGIWQGAMERDNGDYILYQGGHRVLTLDWVERYRKRQINQAGSVKPEVKLNYVLRSKGNLDFDFEIFSVLVPLETSKKKYNLILPRSAENDSIDRKNQYNKGVNSGANLLRLTEQRVYRERTVQKKIRWSWNRKLGDFTSEHSVDVVLLVKKVVR